MQFCIDWIDVETTGIEAHNEHLLQVSCLVTDLELNLLDETGYTSEILYSSEEINFMKSSTSPYVLNMHETTGLWDKLSTGKPLNQVDTELRNYLADFHATEEGYLGGNSITLDRNFLNHHLPNTAGFLHYRSIDVTGLAILAEAWYNGLVFPKRNTHDAKDDIRESLDQLKFLRKTIFK